MNSDIAQSLMKMQVLFQFIMDVVKLALGFGLGAYVALRFGCPRAKKCRCELGIHGGD